MRRDKKDEEASAGNPFLNLDKTAVLQEVLLLIIIIVFQLINHSFPNEILHVF